MPTDWRRLSGGHGPPRSVTVMDRSRRKQTLGDGGWLGNDVLPMEQLQARLANGTRNASIFGPRGAGQRQAVSSKAARLERDVCEAQRGMARGEITSGKRGRATRNTLRRRGRRAQETLGDVGRKGDETLRAENLLVLVVSEGVASSSETDADSCWLQVDRVDRET